MRRVMKRLNLRQTFAGILAISMVIASSTAMAGGGRHGGHYGGYGYSGGHYKHGYGHHRGYKYGHHKRHHYRHHGHRGGNGWVPFAVIGGLAAGYLISESSHRNRATTYTTSTTYHGAATRPCHVVHKIDSVDGYQSKSAATMCYDARGYAYIVPGSQHVID